MSLTTVRSYFTSLSSNYRVFQKKLYNGIPNVSVASGTITFTLKGVQKIHRSRCYTTDSLYAFKRKHSPHSNIRNAIVKLLLKHPALLVCHTGPYSILDKPQRVSLHYDGSKHCTCPLNKCLQASEVVKLFSKQSVSCTVLRTHSPLLHATPSI
jgi:hypothetical protein